MEHFLDGARIWGEAPDSCQLLRAAACFPGSDSIVTIASIQQLVLMPLEEIPGMILIPQQRVQTRSGRKVAVDIWIIRK